MSEAMGVMYFRPLIVDELVVTGKIGSYALLAETQDRLKLLLKAAKEVFPNGKIVRTIKKSQGVHLHLYPETDRKIAEVQAASTKDGHRYFRLVLYPSKFKGLDFEHTQQVLAQWLKPFTYQSLYHVGRITRLDLAVDDLLHLAHSFLPFRRLCNVSGIYTNWCGQKGTTYLGSKYSPLQFANYDKTRQLLETGGQPQYPIQTRFEARLRHLGISPNQALTAVKNPFVRLEIADLAKLHAACTSQKWKDFLGWCSSVGSSKALSMLPSKSMRKEYLKLMRQSSVTWWQPTKVWSDFASAIHSLAPSF